MQMYNDRPPVEFIALAVANSQDAQSAQSQGNASKIPQPEISIIVDGNKILKPGMKSVFIEDDESITIGQDEDSGSGGSYCSCNTVQFCTCNTVCTCESVCTCNPLCSCNPLCTCNPHCSCESHCGSYNPCSCVSRSTQTGCSCAPVH